MQKQHLQSAFFSQSNHPLNVSPKRLASYLGHFQPTDRLDRGFSPLWFFSHAPGDKWGPTLIMTCHSWCPQHVQNLYLLVANHAANTVCNDHNFHIPVQHNTCAWFFNYQYTNTDYFCYTLNMCRDQLPLRLYAGGCHSIQLHNLCLIVPIRFFGVPQCLAWIVVRWGRCFSLIEDVQRNRPM